MSNKIPGFEEWCKNPSQYSKNLSPTTLTFWKVQCDAIKAASDAINDITHIHFPHDLAKNVEKAASDMIIAMLSPQGLAMISAIYGVNFAVSKTFNVVVTKGFANYFSKSLLKNGINMVEKEFADVASANASALLTGVIKYGFRQIVSDGVKWIGVNSLVYGAAFLLKGAEVLFEFLNEALMALQLFGMAFDAWDPCNLKVQLDAVAIQQYNQTYDEVFRKTMLSTLSTMTDGWGNIYYNDAWPIELYAENAFLLTESGDDDYYDVLQSSLSAYYLSNLKLNAIGQPICVLVDPGNVKDSLSFNHLQQIEQKIAMNLADGNQVVSNWLQKYSPIIVGVIVIIVILLLRFIFKRENVY